jgi:hypothetical protein
LVYFPPFWHVVSIKIWQPCLPLLFSSVKLSRKTARWQPLLEQSQYSIALNGFEECRKAFF